MKTADWIPIIVAVIALAGTLFGAVQQRRGAREAAVQAERLRRVDAEAEAYKRARETYRELLDEMQEQLDRLRGQIAELHAQLEAEQTTSIGLRAQIRDLRTQVDELEKTVVDLRHRLAQGRAEVATAAESANVSQGGGHDA